MLEDSNNKDATAQVRILVVENDRVNQKVTKATFESLGYIVDVACDGNEAIRLIGLMDYNLVFMDCHMPDKDGYLATKEIRGNKKFDNYCTHC